MDFQYSERCQEFRGRLTEPDVASSDATNIAADRARRRRVRALRAQVVDIRGASPHRRILIVMGKTDPDGRTYAQDWIAESRIEIEMVRLLTLKTAWLMDAV